MTGNRHKQKYRKFCLNMRKKLLYWEGDGALAQVAQRDCGVSFPGNTQKLFGCNPG